MIENNLQRRRTGRRSIMPSSSLRGHFFALARQVRQWAEPKLDLQRTISIGVTSLERGCGASTVSFNLTCALASLCRTRSLLVESDFGSHYITRRLGHSKAPGLAELLLEVASLDESVFATPIPNVSIIGSGQKDQQSSLELPFDTLEPMLAETLQDYSYVVFDLPLASDLTSCHSIAPHLDGVILTVDSNLIDQRRIARFKKQAEAYGTEVIGIVLNKS